MTDPAGVVGVEPGNSNQFSFLNYRDLRDSQIFADVVGSRVTVLNLRSRDNVERVNGLAVTANFFDGLGVGAGIGRVFTARRGQPRTRSTAGGSQLCLLAAAIRWRSSRTWAGAEPEWAVISRPRRSASTVPAGDRLHVARCVRSVERTRPSKPQQARERKWSCRSRATSAA